jgi:UDP-glucose 4-epimerase
LKKILITGGAGFIGSSLISKLLKKFDIYVIDNLSTGKLENIKIFGAKINFFRKNCEDIFHIKLLKKINFHAIIHVAGQASAEKSFEDPYEDIKSNTLSTIRLLEFCVKNKCKRFIYTSSMSVYGDSNARVKETDVLNPKSFYGLSKLLSEKYIQMYKPKIHFTIIRLFNVYGPNQNLKDLKQGMISIYLSQFLNNNKKVLVKGSLKRFRDFIYIDDVVNFLKKIIKNKKTHNKIYNLGLGKKIFIYNLLNKIKLIGNFKKKIDKKSQTPGDQFGIYANVNKIKKELNFYPKITLDEGLRKTYLWAKNL